MSLLIHNDFREFYMICDIYNAVTVNIANDYGLTATNDGDFSCRYIRI